MEMENIANRWMRHCRECQKQTECVDCEDRKALVSMLDEKETESHDRTDKIIFNGLD